MKCIACLVTTFLVLVVLSGCSTEPRTTTIHEPGVYKGEKDPVLALKNRQELIDRFRLVQTDR